MQLREPPKHPRVVSIVGVIVEHLLTGNVAHLPGRDRLFHARVQAMKAVEGRHRLLGSPTTALCRQQLPSFQLSLAAQSVAATCAFDEPLLEQTVEDRLDT